jgi:transcriptional regulator with XRE-family HTH domain
MAQAPTRNPTAAAAACLGALLRRLRMYNGLTQAGLGRRTGYHGSYISAVERSAVRPSYGLVERCDDVLQADGVLLTLWSLADPEGSPRATDGPGRRPRSWPRTAGQLPGERCARRSRPPGEPRRPGWDPGPWPGSSGRWRGSATPPPAPHRGS